MTVSHLASCAHSPASSRIRGDDGCVLAGVTLAFAAKAKTPCSSGRRTRRTTIPTSSPSSTSNAIHRPTARSFGPSRCLDPVRSGNEPHHVGLSRDGRTLALGGLLSVLRGQDQVFFFDVSDPRNPTFIRSDNPPESSITDEFAPLSNGGFLVTFMGGADGAQPGAWSSTTPTRRSCRRGRSTPPDGRIQSARHLDRRGAQPHGHQRLHLPGEDAPRPRHGGTRGPPRQCQGLGPRASRHHQDDRRRRPGAIRPGRWKCS